MIKIRIVLVGEDRFINPSGDNSNSDNGLIPISKLVNQNALEGASPYNPQIALPKFEDSPYYKQAVRFAAPDTTQEDYTPGYHDSIVVANATNKTLGTFPIFSDGFAVTLPDTIWDKKKKAIADYMLKLEEMKSKKPGEYPKYEYQPGNPDWSGAINNNTISDLTQFQEIGHKMGYDVAGSQNIGHPLNPVLNSITAKQRHNIELTKGIGDKITALEGANLSPDTSLGRIAQGAINEFKHYSSLPEDQAVNVNGKMYQGKRGLINDEDFVDRLSQLNNTLGAVTSLHGSAAPILNDIKKKIVEYADLHPGVTMNEVVTNVLESEYPVVDQDGKPVKLDVDNYIDRISHDIANNSQESFQDFDPNNPNPTAPFKMQDIKDYTKDVLGYKKARTIFVSPTPGATGENAKKDASPQYVVNMADKMAKGEPYVTRDTKGSMVPGTNGVTFNLNGVMTVVPYSNKTELVKKVLEMGGGTGEYGDIDAATAIANNLGNKDLFTSVNGKIEQKRPVSDEKASFQQRFNNDLYAISGNNGLPLVDGITIKSVKSLDANKGDNNFQFTSIPDKEKGGKVTVNGAIIPEDVMKATISDPSVWLEWITNPKKQFKFFDSSKTAYIPQDGKATVLSGTYYHKNEKGDDDFVDGTTTYTIYDQNTKKPFVIKPKGNSESQHTITLNDYQVKAITEKPSSLIKESENSYPETQDNTGPVSTQTSTNPNVATKKGGKAGVFAAETVPDNVIKAAHVLVTKGSPSIQQATETVNKLASSTNAADKDYYAKLLQLSSKLNTDSIRKIYKK